MDYQVTVSGGEIYIGGKSVGSSVKLKSFESGQIIASVPPPGQNFLGWSGDTGYLSDISQPDPDFSLTRGGDPMNLEFVASFDTVPPGQSVIDDIDAKLDIIDGKLDDLLDPL